jgi:glycosyltransferase involved in cell wall biosynthesis
MNDMDGRYFDQRWCAPHGIGRFATELHRHLSGYQDVGVLGRPSHPFDGVKLGRFLNRVRAKLYFSPGYNVPIGSRCQVICTIHDLIHIRCSSQSSLAKSLYYRAIQRPVIKRAPVTLTVSEYSRRDIIDWYDVEPDKVVVVGNGVSDAFQPTGEIARRVVPYFLFVGACRSHKNVETLIRAFRQLSQRFEIRLIFVSNDKSVIQKKCESILIDSAYEVVSGADDTKLATYYRGAAALIMPSLFEGFGLPLVEAMASGCPVIASQRASIPDVVDKAGLLFDPENAEELEKMMEAVLVDDQLRSRLIREGLIRAKHFTWPQVLERVNIALAEL